MPWRVAERLDRLAGPTRLVGVLGGYVLAALLAVLVVVVHVAVTDGPDRELSSGMHAFGDAVVFVVAFTFFSALPSGLGLYFLRRVTWVWPLFSALGWTMASTGWLAVATVHLAPTPADFGSVLAVLRIVLAPACMAVLAAVGVAAPSLGTKRVLFSAAAAEALTTCYGALHWLAPLLLRGGR